MSGREALSGAAIDVSVIVAAWKAAGFIERSVRSALASTGVAIEVIVVDDASPDKTFEVAGRIAADDPRIIVQRLSENGGPSAARNAALLISRGRYVAILDADDAVTPERFAALVSVADETRADIVVDNMTEVDEAGKDLGRSLFLKSPEFARGRDIDLATWIRFNNPMSGEDSLGYLKPLIRRQKLLDTETVYDTSLRNSEDYYLVANLLADGARMTFVPSAGYLYTRSATSTSHRLKPSQTRAWLDAEARFVGRYSSALSESARSAQSRRQRILRNVNQLVALIDSIKMKRFGRSARLMASDIGGTAYSAGVLARIAMGKALRRKMV